MKKFYSFLLAFNIIAGSFLNSMYAADITSGTDSTGPAGISHPIRFLSFSAARDNNNVLVKWSIPSENSSHYQLERSENGSIWAPIASFAAAGSVNATNTYEFADRNINMKTVYYRVMQVYINGQYSYSPVISARAQSKNDQIKISAALNSSVLLYFPEEIKDVVTVRLHSISGQVISQQKISKPLGQVLVPLNTNPGKACVINISDGQNLNLSQMVAL